MHFTITDCWGNAVVPTARISVKRIGADSISTLLSYPGESTAQVTQGRVQIFTEADGFFPQTSVLEILGNNLEFQTCLTLAPIEGFNRPQVEVIGVVADAERSGKALRARIVGLYNDINLVALISSAGRFSFPPLQPGRYLLLLVDEAGVKVTKQVDLRGTSATITLP